MEEPKTALSVTGRMLEDKARVVVEFGGPIEYLSLDTDQARAFAATLTHYAECMEAHVAESGGEKAPESEEAQVLRRMLGGRSLAEYPPAFQIEISRGIREELTWQKKTYGSTNVDKAAAHLIADVARTRQSASDRRKMNEINLVARKPGDA